MCSKVSDLGIRISLTYVAGCDISVRFDGIIIVAVSPVGAEDDCLYTHQETPFVLCFALFMSLIKRDYDLILILVSRDIFGRNLM